MMTKKQKMSLITEAERIAALVRADIFFTSVNENVQPNVDRLTKAILNLTMIKDEILRSIVAAEAYSQSGV